MTAKKTKGTPTGLALYQKHAKALRAEIKEGKLLAYTPDGFKEEVRKRCAEEKTMQHLENNTEKKEALPTKKQITKKKEVAAKKTPPQKKTVSKKKAKAPVKKVKSKLPSFKTLGIASIRKTQLYMKPTAVAKLEPGFRFDCGNMQTLQRNIEFNGEVYTPIILRQLDSGTLFVVKGSRRVEAIKRIVKKDGNLKPIPITIVNEEEALRIGTSLNVRKQLNPLEEASILYYHDGTPLNSLATLMGMPVKLVKDRLSLIGACKSIKTALLRHKLTDEQAVSIVRKHPDDTKAQNEAFVSMVGKKQAAEIEKPEPEKVKRRALKTDDGFVSPVRARNLLSSLASAYTSFRRSELPAAKTNESWRDLEDILRRIRNLKVSGKLPIK